MHALLKEHQKSFVLLSGGIDSTTCLGIAIDYHQKNGGSVEAVSIDYGQRHIKETEQAAKICAHYGITHATLDVKGALGQSMLTDPNIEVPNISYDEIKGVSPTYVPFRNGFMLSRLAAHAQLYVNHVLESINFGDHTKEEVDLDGLVTLYFGAHAEDAKNWAYPDCTPEFVGNMASAIYIGTYRSVRLLTPFVHSSKTDIIRKGKELNVPYGLTWSCYKGEEKHCGTCPTCRARKQSFELAGVEDPTQYAA